VIDECGGCDCPTWYTGDACQDKYWIASFKVDLNPPNLDLSNKEDQYYFQQAVLDDLQACLPLTGVSPKWTVNSVSNTVTLWITAGDKSIWVRDNIKRQIFGTNYWNTGAGIDFQSTLTGEKAVASTWEEKDPPNAAGINTPSLFITLAIVLVMGLLMN
jgi:hypothetical protein